MPEDKTIIIISFGALSISVFTLGWNFYRDVVLKARMKVILYIGNIHHGDKIHGPYITINATNLGPGVIVCESINIAKKSCLGFLPRRILKILRLPNKYAHVMHDYTNPYSDKLPKRLTVGEKLTLLLPMDEDSILSVDPSQVGIFDTFGRYHYATTSSLTRATQEYFGKFDKKPWGT